LHQNISF